MTNVPDPLAAPTATTVLRAVIDRMIPADDFPSGWDAGVGDFLNRIFTTDRRGDWPAVERCLHLLDDEARQRTGSAFATMSAGQQDELLLHVERGEVSAPAAWPVAPKRFIALLADLCAEGYYGDPGNGGNHDMIAWRMIGYRPGAGGDRWVRR